MELWHSAPVQKAYLAVYERVMALIHKDISVEDVFKPIPEKSPPAENKPVEAVEAGQKKVIHLEKLDDTDRKALEKILQKASQ